MSTKRHTSPSAPWLRKLLSLLDAPIIEARTKLLEEMQAAHELWFQAREEQEGVGDALDRQLVITLALDALTKAISRGDHLEKLSSDELISLLRSSPVRHYQPAAWELVESLPDAATPSCEAVVAALVHHRDPHVLAHAIAALVRRGHLSLAHRVTLAIDHPFAFLDAAHLLAPVVPDEERSRLAETAWNKAATYERLDDFGDGYITALWLRCIPLWPHGSATSIARLRWLEHRFTLLAPTHVEGNQDHDDLHLLVAQAWAHHQEPERALDWYGRMGPARHTWCESLAPLLSPELARSLHQEAILHTIEEERRARRACEPDERPVLHRALRHLSVAQPGWVVAFVEQLDSWLEAIPECLLYYQLRFLPYLPEAEARPLWQEACSAIHERRWESSTDLDEHLEALLEAAPLFEDALAKLLPWLAQWERAEPLEALLSWPEEWIRSIIPELLARLEREHDEELRRLLEELCHKHPPLQALLTPPGYTPPTTPHRPLLSRGGLSFVLGDLSPREQRRGIELYAQWVTQWSKEEQQHFFEELRVSESHQMGQNAPLPRRSVRIWLDHLLQGDDPHSVTACFPLFVSGSSDTSWLTECLLAHPTVLPLWLHHLRRHLDAELRLSCLAKVLHKNPDSNISTCQAELQLAAQEVLARRKPSPPSSSHVWIRALPWLSEELRMQLWEAWMMEAAPSDHSCHDPGVTPLTTRVAVELGGVERLDALLAAERYLTEHFAGT